MDPMFIENNSPALTCIQTLNNVFQPYFSGNNNNGVQAWQNVYNALITPANGLLFRWVTNVICIKLTYHINKINYLRSDQMKQGLCGMH